MMAAFTGLHQNFYKITLILDNLITALFIVEMIVKLKELKVSGYFGVNWNIFDFILIAISIPAFISWIFNLPLTGLSFFLIFRILRVFKSFRFIKFVPGMGDLIKGVQRALKTSMVIILGFSIYLFVIGILSCYMYRGIDPGHFGNPLKSFYSIFGIFTMEGWAEIPGIISANSSPIIGLLTKLYFVFIVVTGGIFGLSLVNSIFVEAMLSDNTVDIQDKVDEIDRKIDLLMSEMKREE